MIRPLNFPGQRRFQPHCDYCRRPLPGHHGSRDDAEAALERHHTHAHGRSGNHA